MKVTNAEHVQALLRASLHIELYPEQYSFHAGIIAPDYAHNANRSIGCALAWVGHFLVPSKESFLEAAHELGISSYISTMAAEFGYDVNNPQEAANFLRYIAAGNEVWEWDRKTPDTFMQYSDYTG
jgi:hypothetical protein